MLIKVFKIIMAIKTKAINEYNTAVVKQSGRVGTVRYFTRNGLTYVRAASNSSVTNNRTNSQMTQRLLFSSIVALFSTLASHLRGAFQNKEKNQSDYNAFIKANQGMGVYMTKQDRMLGYSVALPVVVAAGKLEEVVTTIKGDNAVTSLALGSLSPAAAKVSALSAAIVANNERWNYGDQLTFVILRQDGKRCKPRYVRIILDREDETLLSALGTFSAVENKLAMAATGDICVGAIHSNPDGYMSYTKLVATESMQTIINSYLTDEAFAAASASYGTSTEKFLVPVKSSDAYISEGGSSGSSSGGSDSGSGGGGSVDPGTVDLEP